MISGVFTCFWRCGSSLGSRSHQSCGVISVQEGQNLSKYFGKSMGLSLLSPNPLSSLYVRGMTTHLQNLARTRTSFFSSQLKNLPLHRRIWTCVGLRFQHSASRAWPPTIRAGPFGRILMPTRGGKGFNDDVATLKKKISPRKKSIRLPQHSELKRLLSQTKGEKWKIAGAVVLLLVSSTVTMSVPFCIGKVVDIINTACKEGDLMNKMNSVCKSLTLIFLLGGLANCGRVYLIQVAGQNIVQKLRERIYTSVLKQEIAFFDKMKSGDLITRLSSDTLLVGQSLTGNISDGLRSACQAVGGLGMMIYVSPHLSMASMLVVPSVAVLAIIYGRYIKKITSNVQGSLAGATNVANERFINIRTVQSFVQENTESKLFNSKLQNVLLFLRKEAKAKAAFYGFTGLSGNLVVLSVFYYGGIMMSEAQLTIGELYSFLVYAVYVGISMGGLSTFYSELMRGLGASTRIWELLDRQPLIPYSGGLIPSRNTSGNIEFKDLVFSYPARPDVNILSGFKLSVPQGSVTAIVGPSGCGKSTLASLLMRFYDPQEGSVILDGYNINTLDTAWLRNQIGTVSQEPVLFSCSIAENIAYGQPDPKNVSMADIEEAAKKANAFNFIMNFPDRFNTLVGERGTMLSGGQRQRIAIARAILKDPQILILDEATSALDAESEHIVQEALERVMLGRTVITIAHRLSTIRNVNRVAVLNGGVIAEQGSYTDLLKIPDGIFKRLVEHQTST